MKKKDIFLTILFFIITLLSFLFSEKYIYIAHNLNASLGLIIFSFNFLISIILLKRMNIRYIKESIFVITISLLIFYLIISIFNTFDSIIDTKLVSDNLRDLFTPNHFIIKDFVIYYPNIFNLVIYSLLFFISLYIFVTIYEVISYYLNDYNGFILAILISFILKELLHTPLISIPKLIDGSLKYQELIKMLTGNFIILIFTSVLILIIYLVIRKKLLTYKK